MPLPRCPDADEYRSGEDDADDEATVEEEEALAAHEGRDVKVSVGMGRRHSGCRGH